MSEQQMSLFGTEEPKGQNIYGAAADPKYMARSSDPPTSKKAAESVSLKVGGRKKLFLETLKKLVKKHRMPCTAYEVAAEAHPYLPGERVEVISQKRETLRKAAGELAHPKPDAKHPPLIRECESRICKAHVTECMTYEPIVF